MPDVEDQLQAEEEDDEEEEDDDYAGSDADGSDSGSDDSDDDSDDGERKRKRPKKVESKAKASKSSDIVIDADEAADLLADAREFYGDAFLAEAKAKADAASTAAEYEALWEDLNADDSAYVNYKLAAAKGNIPVGDGSQTSQSVAKLRALVIPGTAAFKAPSMNAVSGDKPSVDALLRNKARGGNALPIENGPTCVTTGVRKRQRSEPGAAGVSVPDTASLLGPLRHDPAAFQSARASAGGIAADAIASQLRGKDIGELLAMASAAKAVAANKKVAITQTVKFAGKTMTVTRLVTPGTQAAKALADEATQAAARAAISAATMASEGGAASTGAAGSVSLDALVANLDRPEAISTLTKSSLDWDTYKNQHGLDDELERAAKGGFVDKQAFLARVDERKFELEREQRARERSRNELAAMQAGSRR